MAYRSGSLAAGLLAVVIADLALAEDAAPPDVSPTPVANRVIQDWSGTYFGFALATPRGDNTWRQASDGLELVPGDWNGSAMVVSLGHSWQSDRLTYGAQISFGSGQYSADPTSATFISCAACSTTASDLLRLTGRFGFATGQTHFFANGGLAKANVTATNLFGLLVVADQSMTGWTAGLGVEQRIGENLSLSVSYDHADLGTLDLPTYLPTGQTEVNIDLMQVGMNVRW
ncbi:outer membrane protein [Rhodobacter sp. SY28-1]|uniref:outer membrane protein n=1 Tax=Rhodobacter sp. SY28-1 TaxID=2562317 RepID=UPI0010C11684|nr:outer membrane beta-barrel protein [Rhodobacter sp. SY28-1]